MKAVLMPLAMDSIERKTLQSNSAVSIRQENTDEGHSQQHSKRVRLSAASAGKEHIAETLGGPKTRTRSSVSADDGLPAEQSLQSNIKLGAGYRFVKRTFDVTISLAATIVGVLFGLLLAAVIAADTKGCPIYSQIRIGYHGKPFRLYKFRSMVVDSDDVEKHLSPKQLEEWTRERKVENDPRITRIGSFLRKTSLDELPQFFNVLRGDMSLIGPRPVVKEEIAEYGLDASTLLSVKPGITGLWQVRARNEATYENGVRQDLELFYVRNAGFALDVKIFFETFGAIVRKTGK